MSLDASVMDHYGLIDWDRDGDYADDAEDVTADILAAPNGPGFTCSWGRDQPRAFSPPVVPEADTELNNEEGTYSNLYTGSPLYGYVQRGAPALWEIQHGYDVPFNDPSVLMNDTHTLFNGLSRRRLFTGSVWDVEESGNMGSYVARIKLLSTVGLLLTGKTVTTQQIYTGLRTDQILHLILDEIGWPSGSRIIGTGQQVVNYWWSVDRNALELCVEMLVTEGASAVMYIDASGNFVFRPRDWRDTNPRSMVPQAVFSDTLFGADPDFNSTFITMNDVGTLFNGIPDVSLYYVEEPEIRANPDDVVNSASATVNTRSLSALGPVWSYPDTILLGVGGSIDLWPETSEPFQGAIVPVSGTDYTSTNPVNMTLQALTGQQAKLTITAPTGATITGLQLRAQILQVTGTTRLVTTLSPSLLADSVQRHGDKSFTVPIWPEIIANDAQDLVNGLVLRYLRLRPQFRFATVAVDRDHQNAIFSLDVDDRITLINRRRAISTDVFIEHVEHRTISKSVHMAIYGCEQVYENISARWDQSSFDIDSPSDPTVRVGYWGF